VYRRAIRLVVLVAACWASPAAAVTVGILRPPRPASVTAQALIRVSGEMRSLGLEPRMLDDTGGETTGGEGAGAEPLSVVAAGTGVDAVIAVRGTPLPVAVEVWATNGKGRAVNRSVSLEAGVERAPQTIAIRAIELLRSCLLEIDLLATPPAPESIAAAGDGGAGEPAGPPERRFGFGGGGVVVLTADGVGPAVLPYLRFDWRLLPVWLLRVEVAGAGTAGAVDGTAGSARVTQDQALVGGAYQPLAGHRLRPIFGLSAGALRVAADGRALPAYDSQRVARWSFLMTGMAGASLALGERWDVTAAVQVQGAAPYPAVRFVGETVATVGHPNVLLGVAVELWL